MSRKPTPHVMDALRLIAAGDEPAQRFNPGVVRKLMHEDWAEPVPGPAINQRAKPGDTITYLRIMPAGRDILAGRSPQLTKALTILMKGVDE